MKYFSWIWLIQAIFFLLPGTIHADSSLLSTKDRQIKQTDINTISNRESSTFYRRSRSYGVTPQRDPPAYVRNLSQTGIDTFKNLYWLDAGLENRTRFEFRDNDIRRPQITNDYPILLRSRAYLGIREILDPLRLAIEFQDSRRYDGKFPKDNRDWDEYDLLQIYGELYFKDALGRIIWEIPAPSESVVAA
ncbi:Alginate export [Nitrosomonas eutropha]|uniref:Alginate export n=1 Tax=Nitrosomonas eutropha TaxID=916 RepID=A0A1I7G6U7_9PROT|nr:alginate export family protein [Nitrosomonas eutropha]SFU44189.1 Alginate export [Nitrosomonas eutropha]